MPLTSGRLLVVAGVAALVCGATPAAADPPVRLGAASSFAVLGGSSVDNAGATIVTGDVGVSPGSAINGFPPGTLAVGDFFRDNATARQAHNDAVAAYNELASRVCGVGIRCISSPLQASCGAAEVCVFRLIGPLLVVDADVKIRLSALSSNVFWQVDGSATLEAGSSFVGTILARDGVAFAKDASISGRVLALNGAVTTDTDNLTFCCDPLDVAPDLTNATVNVPYTATLRGGGGTAPYTFALFDGALPPGLSLSADGTIAGTPTAAGTFTFTVRVKDAHGCSDLRTYRSFVVCGPELQPAVPLSDATACVLYEATIAAGVTHGLPSWLIPDGAKIHGTPPPSADDVVFSVSGTAASGCPFTQPYTLHVKCGIVAAPAALPKATIGEPYDETISASCGILPFSFDVIKARIPHNLSLPPRITGIPIETGLFPFTVQITDSSPRHCSTTIDYTIEVVCGKLVFSPEALPDGDTCTFYKQSISVSGGLPPYTFDVPNPPPGLDFAPRPPLSGTAVTLSGFPTAPGTSDVTIIATDAAGCQGTKTYRIKIAPPTPLTLLPESLPPACIGGEYKQQIAASCGARAIVFAVTAGKLPDDLKLSTGGLISGSVAPTAQTSTFTVTATATDAPSVTGSRTYTIAVDPPITINPPTLPDGVVGGQYKATITASGGSGSFLFTPEKINEWLTLTRIDDFSAILSGTPPAAGTYDFDVTATDSAGCSATKQYTLTIRSRPPCGDLQLSPSSHLLAGGTVGMMYSQQFIASRVTPPQPLNPSYQFSIPVPLTVPPGLTLSTTGLLSGFPSMPGRFNFAVVVTDANGETNCSQVYEIVVAP